MKKSHGLLMGDSHCGHVVGLTHPDFDACPSRNNLLAYGLYKARRSYWDFFTQTIKELQPIDFVIHVGDAIDGKGEKSGGLELITNDLFEQCDMAVASIEEVGTKSIYMCKGTPYHAGIEEYESRIAKDVKAKNISEHNWYNANGLIIDYRHYIGSSSVPQGRHTALAGQRVWNVLWSDDWGEYPKSDLIVRGHVHYFSFAGGPNWVGMTLPALCGKGSKNGNLRCSGLVHFGMISLEIADKENWSWSRHILKQARQEPLR